MKLRRILAVVLAVAMVAGFAVSASAAIRTYGANQARFTNPDGSIGYYGKAALGNYLSGPFKTLDDTTAMKFSWKLFEETPGSAQVNRLTVSGRINLGEVVLGTDGFLYFDRLGVDNTVELVVIDKYGVPDLSIPPVTLRVDRFRVDGNDGLTIPGVATTPDIFAERFLSTRCDLGIAGGFFDVAGDEGFGDHPATFAGFRAATAAIMMSIDTDLVGYLAATGTAFAMNSGLGRTALPYGRVNYPVELVTKQLDGAERHAYEELQKTLTKLTEETGEVYRLAVFANTVSFTGTTYAGAPTSFAAGSIHENKILTNDVIFNTVREDKGTSDTLPYRYGHMINLFTNGPQDQIQQSGWDGSRFNNGVWNGFGGRNLAITETALKSQSIYEIARAADANKKATLTFAVKHPGGIWIDNDAAIQARLPASITVADFKKSFRPYR